MTTIFARATPAGRSAIAVVRISGPRAFDVARTLARWEPKHQRVSLRWLQAPDGTRLDQALILAFKGPRSFTGEDTVELHLHGGPAVVRLVLEVLDDLPWLEAAQPGDFTRRALLNGRLDLAQAELLGDLLSAETAAQHKLAMLGLDGALSERGARWRSLLLKAMAYVEASIDFADEELPASLWTDVVLLLEPVVTEIELDLRGSIVAERLREGFEVAIVGAPNAGKSTLLNLIAGREIALTSSIAGTTRDVLEVRTDLNGLPVTFLDTAGLRTSEDVVEAMGIDRARVRACSADLRVFLVDTLGEEGAFGVERRPGDLVLRSKADLRSEDADAVSGLTGFGVDTMLGAIGRTLGDRVLGASLFGHKRQRVALEEAREDLAQAIAALHHGSFHAEIVAERLRGAVAALDFLVGRVDVEAVLDVVFQSFCLGK